MVYIGGRGEESVRRRADGGDGGGGVAMATGTERSKPPLHNFNLPCLKWGNQKHLRCMKPADSSNSGGTNPRTGGGGGERGISFDRHRRSSRSPPSKFAASSRDYDPRHQQFKRPKPRIGGAGGGGGGGAGADEGIEALGEKIMLDLKTAADRMKIEILRKEVRDEDDEEDEDEDEDQDRRRKSSSPAAAMPTKSAVTVSAGGGEKEHEPRPWNLRTRRAACKAPATTSTTTTTHAPIGATAAIPAAASTAKGLRIEERKESSSYGYSPIRSDTGKLPRLRGGDKKEPRAKFTVGLSRKEIEDDFLAMVGHRPARRPKKRPRIVQKQMDTLFPGLWLGEVTVDTYKVPEIPDIGKR